MAEMRARRKWLRCGVRLPVKVKVLDEKSKGVWTCSGSTVNLGGGGAMLEVPGIGEELIENLIKEKYVLQLALELPNIFSTVKIKTKVTWIEGHGKIPAKLGVSFENLPEKKVIRIVDYVENRLSDEITNHAFKRALEKHLKGKDSEKEAEDEVR